MIPEGMVTRRNSRAELKKLCAANAVRRSLPLLSKSCPPKPFKSRAVVVCRR
jgi:hypothetical protein